MADVVVRNLTKTFGKDRIHRTHSIAFKRQGAQGRRQQLVQPQKRWGRPLVTTAPLVLPHRLPS